MSKKRLKHQRNQQKSLYPITLRIQKALTLNKSKLQKKTKIHLPHLYLHLKLPQGPQLLLENSEVDLQRTTFA